MTKSEFSYWTSIMRNSQHKWMLDSVRKANAGELLMFKGGTDGIFVLIDGNGKATGGAYEGAIPHIGEAIFHFQHERQFHSQEDAFESLTRTLGAQFLADIVRGH